jgi:hypothetical protein
MPAQQPLITQGKVQVKADEEASIAAVAQGKKPIHFRATKQARPPITRMQKWAAFTLEIGKHQETIST